MTVSRSDDGLVPIVVDTREQEPYGFDAGRVRGDPPRTPGRRLFVGGNGIDRGGGAEVTSGFRLHGHPQPGAFLSGTEPPGCV